MSKTKKLFASTASVALVAAAIVPAASAAQLNDADKIPTWAQESVQYLVDNGAVTGDNNGNFNPAGSLTRAQAAQILSKLLKLDATGTENFNDVKEGQWFYDAVVATSPEIFEGDDKGNFNPNAKLTRQEAAKVLVSAFGLTGTADLNDFADASKVPAWAAPFVKTAVANGVINGKNGLLAPTDTITNAEFAVMAKGAVDATAEEVGNKVSSVEAINATQIEVKFANSVDAKSLFVDGVSGAFKANVVSIRSIDSVTDGTLTGELSEDGKVLTVTSTQLFEKRYDVTIDQVKATSGEAIEKYNELITIAKDVTAPSIVGTEVVTANQVKIKFSEPMASAGSATFKLADGTVVTDIAGHGTLVDGGKAILLDLSNTNVPVSKDITATIIGAADKAGNLLNPNPATVTFQKGDKDGVAPTVSSITQSGAKTFEIKFSEAIVGKPTVAIDSTPVDAANVVVDSKDATKVTVTAGSVLDGDKIITVSNFVDGSGEVGTITNSVIKFVKDTAAPQLVSSAVVADETDKAEYLEFTFDKNVDLATATVDVTSGSYVKDFVTTSIADADIDASAIDYKDASNKKVVRVKLDTLLGDTDVEGAKYSVNLAFANVTSEADVAITTATATFTRGKDGVAANKEVIELTDVSQGSTNNEVVVTFDKNVDAATASNAANYIVGGAVVESATVNSANLKEVTLKLKENSNTFSGVRNVTVQNVKAAGSSVAMTTVTKAVDLNENVAPTVTAQLQSDLQTIKLSFSENVFQAADTTNDFALLVGTEAYKFNDAALNVDSGLPTADAAAVNTITIELPAKVTAEQLIKGLSLEALDTMDIKDAKGNKLSVSGKVTISQ